MKYASGKYFAQICGEIVPKVVYQEQPSKQENYNSAQYFPCFRSRFISRCH